MASHDHTAGGAGTTGGSQLNRLSEIDDFKVADGFPDIRGWDVKTADGTKVGKVDELIVDTSAMRVRYVDVELDRTVRELARDATTPGDQEAHTLLPIGSVELDDAHDDVLTNALTADAIARLPRYSGRGITGDYERSLRDRLRGGSSATAGTAGVATGAAAAGAGIAAHADRHDYDADDHYDDQRAFARRRTGRDAAAGATGTAGAAAGGEQRITLAEEQLDVSTRQTEGGRVDVRKTVDVEHVRESVPVTREEVTVERHAVSADSVATPQIGDDEIRIPVMEERLVVEKKLVPREEIIVRKSAVTEQRTVEGDVRRERLDVDDDAARGAGLVSGAGTSTARGTTGTTGVRGNEAGMSGAADRATDSGPLDRTADKLDDVKDRVDGNPASRPGPDATDRRI